MNAHKHADKFNVVLIFINVRMAGGLAGGEARSHGTWNIKHI